MDRTAAPPTLTKSREWSWLLRSSQSEAVWLGYEACILFKPLTFFGPSFVWTKNFQLSQWSLSIHLPCWVLRLQTAVIGSRSTLARAAFGKSWIRRRNQALTLSHWNPFFSCFSLFLTYKHNFQTLVKRGNIAIGLSDSEKLARLLITQAINTALKRTTPCSRCRC